VSGPDEILRLTAGAGPVVFAHGNYLPEEAPVPANGTVVYCPRTHAAFGHEPHPLPDLLRRGVRVALGTDSLASNPDLNVLAEARFVRSRFPDLPAGLILRMATLSGAEALGFASDCGSLTTGKWADLAAVSLPDADGEPGALLVDGEGVVTAAWWHGRKVT
jgi:cytosine/adenosine deaminase-related metal-dependent hydrolase